jgi:hypothetical protein
VKFSLGFYNDFPLGAYRPLPAVIMEIRDAHDSQPDLRSSSSVSGNDSVAQNASDGGSGDELGLLRGISPSDDGRTQPLLVVSKTSPCTS